MLPTGATGDLAAAITAADTRGRPVVAVVLTQPESVRMLGPSPLPRLRQPGRLVAAQPGRRGRRIPAYGGPEIAVRALARAAAYGAWRAEPRGHVPEFADIRTADARSLVRAAPGPGWLGPEQAAALLRCYGLPLADLPPAGTEVTVRVTGDPMFGSLVTLARHGAAPAPRAARLTPLTDQDAGQLIAAAGLTDNHSHARLADLLLRVGRLADDLPEVAELELSPVIAGPGRGGRGQRAGPAGAVPAPGPLPAQVALKCRAG